MRADKQRAIGIDGFVRCVCAERVAGKGRAEGAHFLCFLAAWNRAPGRKDPADGTLHE